MWTARRSIVVRYVLLPAIAGGTLLVTLKWRSHDSDPLRQLVEAATVTGREVQPRLSGGFPWAPLRPRASVPEISDDVAMRGVAEEIGRQEPESTTRHATALVNVLTGRPHHAVRLLEALARERADERIWNDLAAAHYVVAIRDDDPSHFARALVAADAALRINGAMPEARFNRALIIEALGIRTRARDAWDAYVRIDPGSGWAVEAREHSRALAPEESFLDALKRVSDPAGAHALARRFPQESRSWTGREILADWADAERDGNHALASKHLGLARELGVQLARDRGEQFVTALTDAIDRADARQRAALVRAHMDFRKGMRVYRQRHYADAEPILARAAQEFARGGSAGEREALFYCAGTIVQQGRIAESRVKTEALLATAPAAFPGHRAGLLWQLGSNAITEGRWGDVIDLFTQSVAIFEQIGESNYAATARAHLVTAYDRIGNPALAWKHRMLVLRELGRTDSDRLQQTIASATKAYAMARDWPAALSFLGLEIDVARQITAPTLHIEALLARAEVHLRMHQRPAAIDDLAAARKLIAEQHDDALRRHLDISATMVEASLDSDPANVVAMLTRAIDFHSTRGRRMHLPTLFMRRGHAYRELRDDGRAAADFESGIVELESHRQSLPGGEDRYGVFRTADELFSGAIALALARQDPETAFAYAERARARALLETLGSPWPRVSTADVPAGTAIVEYAVRADAIVIFILDERGVRAIVHPVARGALEAEIAELVSAAAAADRRQLRTFGRALHRRLFEPLENELAGKRTLALVPDPALGSIPFAALVDRDGHYLAEKYALTIEPSAAVFARLRKSRRRSERQALIVTGPGVPAARRETRSVAGSYAQATLLERDVATIEAFTREAAQADIIHFAGHAVPSNSGGRAGYLLFANERLDLKRIAAMKLSRPSLVVLAACDTAAGETRGTEGTISLARAFLAAGVPSVIATLWPIQDEQAAEFFPVLHQHLARGLAPAAALRETQLEWIRRGDEKSIALWSAVQVIGE